MLASRSLKITQHSPTGKNSEEYGIQAGGTFEGACYPLENKDDLIEFWKLKAELNMLGAADLLRTASSQKEHKCASNPSGSCELYFKYIGFGFCVAELSSGRCEAGKSAGTGTFGGVNSCEKGGPSVALSLGFYRQLRSPFVWKRVMSEFIPKNMTRVWLRSWAGACTR